MRLQNKTALVTGAGSGLGKSIAETFAREGASVVVNDINPETGRAVTDRINQSGGIASFIQGDTSKEADAEKLVQFSVQTYGCLDILVNNAGVEQVKAIQDVTESEWDYVMNVNLKGVFFLSKHGVRQMVEQQNGNIINMASMAGLAGSALNGVYCASKGGVVQLTRAMALEYRDFNIRVNAICPAIIKTDLADRFMDGYKSLGVPIEEAIAGRQHRIGAVAEVANAALFLASDESSFINGVALPVDGGMSAG